MIEDAAQHNGIVRRVVMPKPIAGGVRAPRQLWPGEKPMKKASIEMIEKLLEVIGITVGRGEPFASANLPDKVCFAREFMAGNITTIAQRMFALNRLAIHFGQENMREGV